MAPPPVAASGPPAGGSQIYSRYVPYDAHNNTAAPVPMTMGGYTAPPVPPAHTSIPIAHPPAAHYPSTTMPPAANHINMNINTAAQPNTPSQPSPPMNSNKLLGNKAVFSPPGDAEVVTLGSSSSSVL